MYDYYGMLTGKELGKAIAEAIKKKGVTKAALARHFDVKPPSIQDWVNKGTIDKSRLPELWSYFADAVGPSHWGLNVYPSGQQSETEFVGRAAVPRRIPIVGTARMGTEGFYEELSSIPGAGDGFVELASSDSNAYGLRVRGNSMSPAIRDGWYVVIEPNGRPAPGEYVVVKLLTGQSMVKELLYQRADSIEVLSVNGGERLTIYMDEIALLHPVAAVVSPSKWKPD